MSMMTVRMVLRESGTRLLVTDETGQTLLKARLSSGREAHRLACRTLLEGLALFCNARVRVVLSAESEEISCAQGLLDGLGFGKDTLFYEVEVHVPRDQRRSGVGDFRDVRRLCSYAGGAR